MLVVNRISQWIERTLALILGCSYVEFTVLSLCTLPEDSRTTFEMQFNFTGVVDQMCDGRQLPRTPRSWIILLC